MDSFVDVIMVVDKMETVKSLSPKQTRYLDLLFLEKDVQLQESELADVTGVKLTTIRKWHRDPIFNKHLEIRIREHSESRMPRVWESVLKKAESGDVAAAKLIFQLRGELVDKKEVATRMPPATLNYVLNKSEDK